MTAAAPVEPERPLLPPLRQELRIEPGAALVTGAPSWTLFDPVRHLFFQLGRIEYRILSRWASGDLEKVSEDLAAEGLDEEEINNAFGQVVDFSLSQQPHHQAHGRHCRELHRTAGNREKSLVEMDAR